MSVTYIWAHGMKNKKNKKKTKTTPWQEILMIYFISYVFINITIIKANRLCSRLLLISTIII